MEYYDKILIALGLVCSVLLYLLAGYAVKAVSSKWKLCYCVPAVICMIIAAVGGFEASMLGAYIGSVLLLAGFFRETPGFRRIICAVSAVCVIISLPVCLLNEGYRTVSFAGDFEKGFSEMRKRYVLSEHKGIDWDALYREYLPRFRAADKTHDKVENFIAWASFCNEFYDGHVGFYPGGEDVIEAAYERICGNDYGLAVISLDDGRAAAVNVEEGSVPAEAGIRNGTIITAWDGKTLAEAAANSEITDFEAYPDKDCRDFYRLLPAGGVGGEEVEISFLDDSGAEKTVTAPKTGSYYERLNDTAEIINQGVAAANMAWTEADGSTAVLRIKTMMFDGNAARSEDFTAMKNEIRENAEKYKSRGFENIIIDLRGNGGGSGNMVMAIAEIFAPEGPHYYCTDGAWDDLSGCYLTDPETGKYVKGKDNLYQGENFWEGKPVVILVNSQSASAADHLAMIMQGMENVTVMGFTEPNGSAQGVGAVELESGMLQFSSCLLLDENGDIFIDSGTDFESGDGVDVKIPFDEEAVKVLFDDGEDYVMKKALEYLS